MKSFTKDRLAEVELYLGESNEQVREGMRSTFRDYGLRRTRSFARMTDLIIAIRETPPDLLIVSDDLDPAMCEAVREIRHFTIGRNPFLIISIMVNPENDGAVKRAVLTGADDVMIKPVSPGKLLERIEHITVNRTPFIVTTDYLGPERRKAGDARPSQIRQLHVVNSLKAKVDGKRLSTVELNRAVESDMKDVMSARLDSQGLKLGWVCSHILKAYEEKRIDKELGERLIVLVHVLEDAGRTALALGEQDLAQICTQMARQVEEMAETYENPSSQQIETIRKLTKAFELAKAAKLGSAAAAAP